MGEDDFGAIHFESERIQVLAKVLDDARYGRLEEGWRSAATPKERSPGTPTVYTDGDRLAIEYLHMMAPSEWEPGNARDWRTALDAWFIDSLAIVDAVADFAQNSLNRTRGIARNSWENQLKYLATLRSMGRDADVNQVFSTAESFDSTIDSRAATHELLRRRRHDEIKAEYRAGLAAGGAGLDVDWLDWYANQIRLWPNDEAISNGLAWINQPGFRARLESLPAYWLTTS